MKKKILLLGGSHGQIPAIKEANRRGLYTILCDYLPENPGKELVDKFYLVSTTDKEKVLEVAQKNQIDYVWAYASDPAALTAAYVAEEMSLFGNTPASVELLSDKGFFRHFQHQSKFNTPSYFVADDVNKLVLNDIAAILPVVVKPVDSSDTKGVAKVNRKEEIKSAFKDALQYSRSGKVIIEEFIDSSMGRLHGDAFMVDGDMKFCLLGDQFCTSEVAPLKPTCTIFPSTVSDKKMGRVHSVVGEILKKTGYKNGPVNVEVRINHRNEIYIMELGPRSGGILTPESIFCYSGFDMLKAQIDQLMERDIEIKPSKNGCVIRFTISSNIQGIFEEFVIPKDLESSVYKYKLFAEPNDEIKPINYPGSNIGVLILKFESPAEMKNYSDLFKKINMGLSIQEKNNSKS